MSKVETMRGAHTFVKDDFINLGGKSWHPSSLEAITGQSSTVTFVNFSCAGLACNFPQEEREDNARF
jgi:hypothetical protein